MKWYVEIVVEGLTQDLTPIYVDENRPALDYGFYSAATGRQESRWGVEADSAAAAAAQAQRMWREAFGDAVADAEPIGLIIRTEAEQERHNLQTLDLAGELVGVTDIAKMLNVSHQRVSKLARTDPQFPPGGELAGRTVYPKFLAQMYVKQRQEKAANT